MSSDQTQANRHDSTVARRGALRLHWLRQCTVVLLMLASQPACASLGPAKLDEGIVAPAAPISSPAGTPEAAVLDGGILRTAAWPWSFFRPHSQPIYDSLPCDVTPHPAVARIIVPEKCATAYGSGTLIDVRDQHGLVVTNWHVVRDARREVEVVFPGGFRSQARPLKVDSNWDLAALVVWRPPVEPVRLATQPPRPGDLLTIHGYGRGQYRIATGRCTTYYAPRPNYPHEMVELDVEARQGDSGGPIFNQSGELAGVLFGAGEGTTLGSFAPRVRNFLATIAPDIGNDEMQVAAADRPAPSLRTGALDGWSAGSSNYPSSPWTPFGGATQVAVANRSINAANRNRTAGADEPTREDLTGCNVTRSGWYDPLKSILAAIGLAAITLRLIKTVR